MTDLNHVQFAEHLHEVPLTLRWKSAEEAEVRHVPTSALDHVYSAEYDVPAHKIPEARTARLKEERDYPEDLRHPSDNPGAHERLTEDIKAHGIHTPIAMTMYTDGGDYGYGIRDGSHRYLVARQLGLSHVPVKVTR